MSPANIVACEVCDQVHQLPALAPGSVAKCVRCGATLARKSPHSLHRTAALSLAALLLFIPANVLPILNIEMYGTTSQNTVWDGVVKFYQDGSYFISAVVLMASILIPLFKLAGLFFITITAWRKWKRLQQFRSLIYRFIEAIGRWAMLDVFVVGIWISAVKMGQLATVSPGRGLLPFATVVVLTLLASASFDPKLIWEPAEEST